MAVNSIIRRTASFLGFGGVHHAKDDAPEPEVIFCKNNVCVHPPSLLRIETDHHPGYLMIRNRTDEVLGSTLILTWIPNSTLKRIPRSIENRTPLSSPCRSTRSSASPSPHSPRHFDPGRPSSTSPRMSICSERSHDDFTRFIFNSIISENECKKTHSITSTVSEMGSPRDDNCSLDSWSQSGSGESQSMTKDGNSQLHLDSGIGVEDSAMAECSTPHSSSLRKSSEPDILDDEHSKEVHRKHCHRDAQASVECSPYHDEGGIAIGRKNRSGPHEEKDLSHSPLPDLVLSGREKTYKQHQWNIDLHIKDDDDSDTLKDDLESLSLSSKLKNKNENGCNRITYRESDDLDDDDANSCNSFPSDSSQSFPSTPTEPESPVKAFRIHTNYYLEETPETVAMHHNLSFPENISHSTTPSPDVKEEQQCGIFSVDLGQMRSLRMFFSNSDCTCGQLVIASRESQYKILHFHYGGLDKLATVFEQWNVLVKPKNKNDNCPYRQFSICRPQVTQDECHPEDGIYEMVDDEVWHSHLNDEGRIEDHFFLRKTIFFGALDPSIRRDVWPFLLHCYSFSSTFDEREQLRAHRHVEYQEIITKRQNLSVEEQEKFWRNVQCTVEKDVIRTDRSNIFYAGDNNPNVEIMKNILLNYAIYNPEMGYTQGMSDLLAPVLVEIQNELDAFWCFVGLMQRTIFVSSPKDLDMDKNLNYLRELIRLMVPKFYDHLESKLDGLELLFTHRWILLCFKREFAETDALKMWEACWANYQTDYFHLFLCVAIIAIYGEDVIQQDLPSDEMLLHFSSLAMHMDGQLVLRKARGLLHQYRKMPRVPCSLHGLCEICGPGMWDSGHVPSVVCSGNHGNYSCPYGGQDNGLSKNTT